MLEKSFFSEFFDGSDLYTSSGTTVVETNFLGHIQIGGIQFLSHFISRPIPSRQSIKQTNPKKGKKPNPYFRLIMFGLIFICLFAVTKALHGIRPGELYISKIYGIAVHMNIGIVDEKAAVKVGLTSFEYDMNGSLKVINGKKYIGFNYLGELALSDEPQFGFSLQTKPGMKFTRTLFFRYLSNFVLCGNGLIRCDTNCRDAQLITITYEDILHPYGKPKMIGLMK